MLGDAVASRETHEIEVKVGSHLPHGYSRGLAPQHQGGVRASGRGDCSEPVGPLPRRPDSLLLRVPPVGSTPNSGPGTCPGGALLAVAAGPAARRQSPTREADGASPPCLQAGAPAPQSWWLAGRSQGCVDASGRVNQNVEPSP